ncbi:helix-turn-helix domain-containing protein [Geobacter sp. AOG1]|uniref:helix-turn-helix domain-containing protein n=1 Tax=Geobacter sp. AOG1 TaxID=1566346 RepID=UPI001CC65232|nr:helix-turn-helix domain-containing protein [Geobacter sp. AOG1]GFE58006.1 hypothetical protein AOG1_18860 [Geobacter sp. AOG1]
MLKQKCVQTVQTTKKTLELLDILSNGDENLHIGDLARKLGIGREEALLLLVTMESHGMVAWDDREKIYRPGWKSEKMARQFLHLNEGTSTRRLFRDA